MAKKIKEKFELSDIVRNIICEAHANAGDYSFVLKCLEKYRTEQMFISLCKVLVKKNEFHKKIDFFLQQYADLKYSPIVKQAVFSYLYEYGDLSILDKIYEKHFGTLLIPYDANKARIMKQERSTF